MIDSLYIAWKYILYNKSKTIIVICCISLITFLPLALQVIMNESEHLLRSRAQDTPLIVGAKGSALDLVMNSLYFDKQSPQRISMQAVNFIDSSQLAMPIPLYIQYRTRGFPIIGTTLDYFDFRDLNIEQGRMFATLGECVIGSDIAARLRLSVGDSLVSSPDNLFDIAGIYPLKMKIVGVLAASHSADDQGVFVDIKTAWVIEGLGHGHVDVNKTNDSSVILKREKNSVSANAKLMHYTEINEQNIDSFHFHGALDNYPLTAVIAEPHDDKSATLLRGRFLENEKYQIVVAKKVIDGLMGNIFRIKDLMDAIILLVGIGMVVAIILIFSLSLKIRGSEITTIFRLGCNRLAIAKLLTAEIVIIGLICIALCAVLLAGVNAYAEELVRLLIIR